MFIPDWLIGVSVVAFVGLVTAVCVFVSEQYKTDRANPLPMPISHPHTSKIERLRQNLRTKTLHNEELIDRMIRNERERLPNANEEVWMEAAIARWERDNR